MRILRGCVQDLGQRWDDASIPGKGQSDIGQTMRLWPFPGMRVTLVAPIFGRTRPPGQGAAQDFGKYLVSRGHLLGGCQPALTPVQQMT